jgi:predicted nucleic-acid-binding Zn-ribbon protein
MTLKEKKEKFFWIKCDKCGRVDFSRKEKSVYKNDWTNWAWNSLPYYGWYHFKNVDKQLSIFEIKSNSKWINICPTCRYRLIFPQY